ncbi:hypothetical protein MNBD_GAMMA14-729 [hydrothermal vent metagenome]|uniref:Uncharacterized protein n=1 Tax=hydrothermal vent metagenome TaxID=652676 RepID=A0A3B0YQE6_9ZZZZ
MQNNKTILLIAQNNKPEALRIASGLTLLDDQVKVDVDGELGTDAETSLQLEALEFAEVPVERLELSTTEDFDRLAKDIISADVVFIV